MRTLCLLFLFVVALVIPFISFPLRVKDTFYPILPTLSGAMLYGKISKFPCQTSVFVFLFFFFNALVYFFVLLGEFGPLYITRGPTEVYFVPISSQSQGFVIIFMCLVSVGTDN